MSQVYNTRVLTYPDGSMQLYRSSRKYCREEVSEREDRKAALRSYYEGLYPDAPAWLIDACLASDYHVEHDGSSVARKEVDNSKRAVQKVYNYAKCNKFEWFVTITFNPDLVEVMDYDACVAAFTKWLRSVWRKRMSYIFVPEQHKSGAWHFHGVVSGDLDLCAAVSPYTGLPLLDKSGRQIYNIGDFVFGFTTATEITDPARTASYLAKYLTKEMSVPKGRKRYWVSRNLRLPEESLEIMTLNDFERNLSKSRYFKSILNLWGEFLLAEYDSGCYSDHEGVSRDLDSYSTK